MCHIKVPPDRNWSDLKFVYRYTPSWKENRQVLVAITCWTGKSPCSSVYFWLYSVYNYPFYSTTLVAITTATTTITKFMISD